MKKKDRNRLMNTLGTRILVAATAVIVLWAQFAPGVALAEQTKMSIDWGDGASIMIDNDPAPSDGWNRVVVEDRVNGTKITKMYRNSWKDTEGRIHSWIVVDARKNCSTSSSEGEPDEARLGPQHIYKENPLPIKIRTEYDSDPNIDGCVESSPGSGKWVSTREITPPTADATGTEPIEYGAENSGFNYGQETPAVLYPSITSPDLPSFRPADAVMPGREPTMTVAYSLPSDSDARDSTEIYGARWNIIYKSDGKVDKIAYFEGFTIKPDIPFVIPSSPDFRSDFSREPFGYGISNLRILFSKNVNADQTDVDNEQIDITVKRNFYISSTETFYDQDYTPVGGGSPKNAIDPRPLLSSEGEEVLTANSVIPIYVLDDKDPEIHSDYSLAAYTISSGVLQCGGEIGALRFYVYDNNLNLIRYAGGTPEERVSAGPGEIGFKTPIDPSPAGLPEVDFDRNCIKESEEDKLADLKLMLADGTVKDFTRFLGGPDLIEKATNAGTSLVDGWSPGVTDKAERWKVRLTWNRVEKEKWPHTFKGSIYPKLMVKNLGPSPQVGKVLPRLQLVDDLKPNVFVEVTEPGRGATYYPTDGAFVSEDTSMSNKIVPDASIPKPTAGYEKPEEIFEKVNFDFADNNTCWYAVVNLFEKTRYTMSVVVHENITQVNNITDLTQPPFSGTCPYHVKVGQVKYKWKDDADFTAVDGPPERIPGTNLLKWKVPGSKQWRNPTTPDTADYLTLSVEDASDLIEPRYTDPRTGGGNQRIFRIFFVAQDTKLKTGTVSGR